MNSPAPTVPTDDHRCDVPVIDGRPAGSTVAALPAARGRDAEAMIPFRHAAKQGARTHEACHVDAIPIDAVPSDTDGVAAS